MSYRVKESELEALGEKLAKVNRKAARLGVPEVDVAWVGYVDEQRASESGEDCYVRYLTFEVRGEPVKLAGWRFVGKLEPVGEGKHLCNAVPGQSVPAQYRDADPYWCEHCKTRRKRKDTLVCVHEDGRAIQVGRTCIKDFTGGHSANAVLASFRLFSEMEGALGEGFGGRWEPEFEIGRFLEVTAAVVRTSGWRSAGVAQEYGGRSTKSEVLGYLDPDPRGANEARYWLQENVTDKDCAKAAEVLAWVRKWAPEQDSDYGRNLTIATSLQGVTRKTAGLTASAVGAYQREIEKAAKREAEAKAAACSGHVGELKERRTFGNVTVLSARQYEGDYGWSTACKFVDDQGNHLTWFASGTKDFEAGERYWMVATVKRHGEYRGVLETQVNRAKLSEPQAVKDAAQDWKAKQAAKYA